MRAWFLEIAILDAPAVLGHDEWHAVDSSIGLASIEAELAALHADSHIAPAATPARQQ